MRVLTSAYLMNGAPSSCEFCGQPFPIKDGHREAFHSPDGYFCTEACAQDALEAAGQRKRMAS